MAGGPTREDTNAVTVTVFRPDDSGAVIVKGIWDKLEGGQVDSEETKYNPGAMADPVSLGGKRTTENVTLRRLYRLGRDHEAIGALMNGAGRSKVTISRQMLDLNGNAYGSPIVYRGILKRVTPPDVDSEGTGPALLEIEVTVDGFPSA